ASCQTASCSGPADGRLALGARDVADLFGEQPPVQGLRHDRAGAEVEASGDGFDILAAGLDDADEGLQRRIVADSGQDLEAVKAGHFEVQEDKVVAAGGEAFERFGAVGGEVDLCGGGGQVDLGERSQDRIVVDEQDPGVVLKDVE